MSYLLVLQVMSLPSCTGAHHWCQARLGDIARAGPSRTRTVTGVQALRRMPSGWTVPEQPASSTQPRCRSLGWRPGGKSRGRTGPDAGYSLQANAKTTEVALLLSRGLLCAERDDHSNGRPLVYRATPRLLQLLGSE